MIGPVILLSKVSFFAMNRTLRPFFCRNAGSPAKVKSMYPVWLIATTAPPSVGRFSTPVTVNFRP
ncbi:Uncharacterised protein [Mycobacteroides abscessus subsp. abscessus]|nr:Uncharacterised protein [Mycobacteroides abscessus subsp. abscessus]